MKQYARLTVGKCICLMMDGVMGLIVKHKLRNILHSLLGGIGPDIRQYLSRVF